MSSIFRHIFIIGTTGISILHFSGGIISLGHVEDVVYGIAMSSFPGLNKSYSFIAWIVPDIEGWRGIMIQWTYIAILLIFLLPESYGRDVRVRLVLAVYLDAETDVIY